LHWIKKARKIFEKGVGQVHLVYPTLAVCRCTNPKAIALFGTHVLPVGCQWSRDVEIWTFAGLEAVGEKGNATQFHAWVANPFQYAMSSSRLMALILRILRSSAASASRLSAKRHSNGRRRRRIDHTNNSQDQSCVLIRNHPSYVICCNSVDGWKIQSNSWERWLTKCNLQSIAINWMHVKN